MQFEFDPDKDKENFARHGVSLAFAETLVWEEALVWLDHRYFYAELRMIALVPGGTSYYVAFVDRIEVRRVISVRQADRREVKHYVENFQ